MMDGLKLILNDYCEKVVPNLFRNSANIPAKRENIVSYPTHITNAVFTGASIYAYEHLGQESKNSIRDLKLLITVLTLHDVGKYLENKYKIMGGNTKDNIKKYFKEDDFRIKEFFPEIEDMIGSNNSFNEIVWLIQNTELKDEDRKETTGHKTAFGKLADYSRLGDKIASLTKNESYVSEIFDTLKYHDVHVVQIPKFPQFLIRKELLKALKKYYEEKEVIPFLLFEDGLFYIHKDVILTEPDRIKEYLLTSINESMKSLLSLRITNQSVDDVSILKFPLPKEDKKRIILKQIIDKISSAMKDVTIVLPADRELQKKLATITYFIYKCDDIKVILKKKLSKKDSQKINEILNNTLRERIKSIRDEVGSQKYKIYMAKELIEHHKDYEIDAVYDSCDNFLNQQLENAGGMNVFDNIIKNISVDFKQTFETGEKPKDKDEMCFLCGTKANTEYRAGQNYFLQAREFSKRGKIFDMQKKICSLCLIERSLIEGLFIKNGYQLTGDYLFAIFYFDRIFANVTYFSREFSNTPLEPKAPITVDRRFRLGDFDGLYFVIPYRYSGREESAKQSSRINITKQILDFINGYGCKAALTSPYTLLRTYNELFVNENPTRLEISLGVHTICDFDELDKKRQFLTAIYKTDRRKGYFSVQSYNPFSFIHFIKLKNNDSNKWTQNEYIYIVKNCFRGEIMKIEEIAQKGKEFFSTGYVQKKSTYEKTKLMRTALDSILVGLQQRLPEDELKIFVSAQIYKLTMREEYAKKKEADRYVKEFVDSLIQYLKEKNWFSVHILSSIEKYLVDTYEFALISISKEE